MSIQSVAIGSVLALSIVLASCANPNRYTGNSYYYWQNNVLWSCREPAAFRGGNCQPDDDWEDGGLPG